jgi:hypothetical protein
VDTGALRDSISAGAPIPTETGASIEISASVPYAACIEYGTARTPARPFLGPALDRLVK